MQCDYFGQCGSCRLYEYSYEEQLKLKSDEIYSSFAAYFNAVDVEIVPTIDGHFRNRVEFKVWHEKNGGLSFAMRRLDNPKGFVPIRQCGIASRPINAMMERMIPLLIKNETLWKKLFEIDFLASSDGEIVISMLYHRPIDETWKEEAGKLKVELGCDIIGRSRGKKIVLDKDYVTEKVNVDGKAYRFRHIENSFTQPNGDINQKIITFLLENTTASDHDLLELYCGMGNLTIPLAKNFNRVLGIEISKSSIASARINIEANKVENITFARMSAEEFTQAMFGHREFERLKDIDLDGYDFKTVLVDPPRSGLDRDSLSLVQKFDRILYISCNPETLKANLAVLSATHTVQKTALFDQFAYTPHLEMGVVLQRKHSI